MKAQKSLMANAALNGIRQLCSVLFPLITIPYVTRVLSAENYGKYNYSNSIVGYFALFAALGISTYAVREGACLREESNKFNDFANEVFSINILSTILSYILFAAMLLLPGLRSYRLLMLVQSLSILFATFGTEWVNTAYEDFCSLTVRYIVMQAVSLVALFLFVKNQDDYIVYAVITVTANAGASLFNAFYVRRYVHLRFVLRRRMKRHLKPILTLFANSLAITIYVNSDTTLLGVLRTDTEVGVYTVAAKIYTIIKNLLYALVAVSVPRLSALAGIKKEEEFRSVMNRVFYMLMTLIPPAMAGLFMLSEEAVNIVAGPEYTSATGALQILCLALFFAILAAFFANCILLPYRMDREFFQATLAGAAVNFVLNFAAIPLWGIYGAALTTLAAELVVLLICVRKSREEQQVELNFRVLLPVLLGCVGVVAICALAKYWFDNIILRAAVAVVCSALFYGITMIAGKNPVVLELVHSLPCKLPGGKKTK